MATTLKAGGRAVFSAAAGDYLQGTVDDDTLTAGDGNDTIEGEEGNDLLIGAGGADRIDGGYDGSDTIRGGDGNDRITIESRDDSDDEDRAFGEAGDDYIDATSTAYRARGLINGGDGIDTVVCRDQLGHLDIIDAEVLDLDSFYNRLAVKASSLMGFDTILFRPRKVIDIDLTGGGVVDLLNYVDDPVRKVDLRGFTRQNLQLYGLGGDDILIGGGGEDTLEGRAGDDHLDGTYRLDRKVDVMLGGEGNDTVWAGTGDSIDAGAGDDEVSIYRFQVGSVEGGDGFDELVVSGTIEGRNVSGFEALTISPLRKMFEASIPSLASFQKISMARDDFGLEIKLISGGSVGFDERTGKSAILIKASAEAVDVAATRHADTVLGSAFDDTLIGGAGDDTLAGRDGNDSIEGGAGNDTFWYAYAFDPGRGNDTLSGGSGDDDLYGGSGDDVLLPGRGLDWVKCGGGSDLVVFESLQDSGKSLLEADLIDAVQADIDKIDLSAIDAIAATPQDDAFTFVGTSGFQRPGELRYEHDPFTDYVLYELDVDGDGRADMALRVDDDVVLSAGDFVL